MIAKNADFKKTLPGFALSFYDAQQAIDSISPGAYASLPYTARIFAECLVRRCEADVLEKALLQCVHRQRTLDFPWYPARIVCHDILGLTALVDLAGLRDAIAAQGGDATLINPVVPTQLIVDHSLAVEYGGFDTNALEKNRNIEKRRNQDRFHFIDWCKQAFENLDIVPAGHGIMHQINLEKLSPVIQVKNGLAFPDSCIGTDSHTPHIDALGVLAIGVGGLEAESVMLGRPCMMRLPTIVGVELIDRCQPNITATDLVLTLTEFLRQQGVGDAFLEFYGEGTHYLSIGDRATIANMTPEYGASAALFYIDEQTLEYLRLTGRNPDQIKLVKSYAQHTGLWATALQNAQYDRVLQFNMSSVERCIAGPSNPHNRIATKHLRSRLNIDTKNKQNNQASNLLYANTHSTELTPSSSSDLTPKPLTNSIPDGAIIIAAITSCTNTSNPRNLIAAGLLAQKANALGLTRKPWVKSSFAPGSKVAQLYLRKAGLLKELEQLGFGIVGFACTTCNGMSGALDPEIQKEIVTRNLLTSAVLSGNRNFDGRIHPNAKQAFLASPPLVVAYALAGTMYFDIDSDAFAKINGVNILLKDIWPSDEEIDNVLNTCIEPNQFQQVYALLFNTDQNNKKVSPLYNWQANSTYIRRPPYWEKILAKPSALENLRPLAILGDNITTDHISPSNAILPDSAAGKYLLKMGIPEEDFNSYATHRGDHLTAQRATFANPTLLNEMAEADNKPLRGSYTRLEPDGQIVNMWQAIETYAKRQQNLMIIAGKNYGQGSSRDWAAKGPRLAGVIVIVAESFERIHRTNLIGMGILPLQFKPDNNRKTLRLQGDEIFSVQGNIQAGSTLQLVYKTIQGESLHCPVTCRIDTTEELTIYQAGGILQRFTHDFLHSFKQKHTT